MWVLGPEAGWGPLGATPSPSQRAGQLRLWGLLFEELMGHLGGGSREGLTGASRPGMMRAQGCGQRVGVGQRQNPKGRAREGPRRATRRGSEVLGAVCLKVGLQTKYKGHTEI